MTGDGQLDTLAAGVGAGPETAQVSIDEHQERLVRPGESGEFHRQQPDTAAAFVVADKTTCIASAPRNVETPLAWELSEDVLDHDVLDVLDYPPTGDQDEVKAERGQWFRAWGYALALVSCAAALAVVVWVVGYGGWEWKQPPDNQAARPATPVVTPEPQPDGPRWCPPGHNADTGCLPVVVPGPSTTTVTVQADPPSHEIPTSTPIPDMSKYFTPPTTPSIPTGDEGYFERLAGMHVNVTDRAKAITIGHWVCYQIDSGYAPVDVTRQLRRLDDQDGLASAFVVAAIKAYCPQYTSSLPTG